MADGPKSWVWLTPRVNKETLSYSFEVTCSNKEPPDPQIGRGTKPDRGGFRCILTGAPISFDYIKERARAGQMGRVLLATVSRSGKSKSFCKADPEQAGAADVTPSEDYPVTDFPARGVSLRIQNYGVHQHWQMFTPRQLEMMVAFSDAIQQIISEIAADAKLAGKSDEYAKEYAESVGTFLALALSRMAPFNTAFNRWIPSTKWVGDVFAAHALRMVWDYAEINPLGSDRGSWKSCVDLVSTSVETIIGDDENTGTAAQRDAVTAFKGEGDLLISTDPPYYDNIGYADLSDFYYIWLRRTIGGLHRDIFSTVLVPKEQELTAEPERFGGNRNSARDYFEQGFQSVFSRLQRSMDNRFPLTVYYAFKQGDTSGPSEEHGQSVDKTTGWETLLKALIASGFQITATWPIRASQPRRLGAISANALASYIVLACRPRPSNAAQTDKRSFLVELKNKLSESLPHFQRANIPPVDLAQAALGPGMAIFSQYSQVLEADGSPMSVRMALRSINQTLDEVLAGQSDDLDPETHFCVAWFEQYGMSARDYGIAEVLMTAKNISFERLMRAGVACGRRGKFRLSERSELESVWNPDTNKGAAHWKCVQYLVRAMTDKEGGGLEEAARLVAQVGPDKAAAAQNLVYRLFTISERRGWNEEALAYNILVTSWPQIQEKVAKSTYGKGQQSALDQ